MQVLQEENLSSEDLELVTKAREATSQSYAPYSEYHVGAALRLENNHIITGSNQENASYPVCLCGERLAILYAQHNYPDLKIDTVAIVARKKEEWSPTPVSPCGVCRQTIGEVSFRQQQDIRLILIGAQEIWILDRLEQVLPSSFNKSHLL